MTEVPWRATREGVVVRVRVTPKSSREGVDGLEATADGAALKVRVRAIPEDGAANTAVTALLAKWLGLPKGSVELVAGGKSRVKTLAVRGDPADLEKALAERLSASSRNKDG